MIHRLTAALLAALAAALGAASCAPSGGEYEITERRTFEQPRAEARARVTSDGRFGRGMAMQSPATPTARIAFDLPDGWVERPGSGMRLASFGVASKPDLDGSITQLSGDGGGDGANVNRWRGQMGLDALDDDAIAALPRVPVMGRPGVWVEARGSYRGMGADVVFEDALLAGVIVSLPAVSIYVKLVGRYEEVEPELDALRAFAASVRLGGGTGQTRPGDGGVPASAGSPFTWTIPEGWRESGPRTMRLVTLHPEDDETTECYVTVLGGDGGGTVDNLNRWRKQMGLGPLGADALADLPLLDILGQQVQYLSAVGAFAGMGDSATRTDQMLLGVFRELGDRAVSVKMTGPRERVELERGRFEDFCRSLEERRP